MFFKFLAFLIELIYWLGLFITPPAICCFFALWLYFDNGEHLLFPILTGISGIILEIVLAEFIKRYYGLNNFASGLSYTSDIDNTNDDKKL